MRCFGDNSAGQRSPPSTDPIGGDRRRHLPLLRDRARRRRDLLRRRLRRDRRPASPALAEPVPAGRRRRRAHLRSARERGCHVLGRERRGAVDSGPRRYVQVSAGGFDSDIAHSCGVTTRGRSALLGHELPGSGRGSSRTRGGRSPQVETSAAACAADLTLGCWGANAPFGQATPPAGLFTAGRGRRATTPARSRRAAPFGVGVTRANGKTTPPPGKFVRIAVGGAASCGVLEDGSVACWGDNDVGAGDVRRSRSTTTTARRAPTTVRSNGNFPQSDADADASR